MGPHKVYGPGDIIYIQLGPCEEHGCFINHVEVDADPLKIVQEFSITGSIIDRHCVKNKEHGDFCMIKKVIYNPPATIIFWTDGTKTVVKCMEGDEFDPEKGLAIGIAQKFVPKKEIKKWLPKNWELPDEEIPDLSGVTWHSGSSTDYDLTATVPFKEDDSKTIKKPSFLDNAIRDLTDIFKGAVKGE